MTNIVDTPVVTIFNKCTCARMLVMIISQYLVLLKVFKSQYLLSSYLIYFYKIGLSLLCQNTLRIIGN